MWRQGRGYYNSTGSSIRFWHHLYQRLASSLAGRRRIHMCGPVTQRRRRRRRRRDFPTEAETEDLLVKIPLPLSLQLLAAV